MADRILTEDGGILLSEDGGALLLEGADLTVACQQFGAMPIFVKRGAAVGYHTFHPVPIITSLSDVSWLPWFPGVIKTIYSPTPSGEKPLGQ